MTPAERALIRSYQGKAAQMSPDIASAILSVLAQIRKAIETGNLGRAVELGHWLQKMDEILAEPVFNPIRAEVRKALNNAIRYATSDIPKKPAGQISVMFDVLNPLHVQAVREIEGKVISSLREEIRDVVRAHVENGLRSGVGPRVVARGLRDVIGLAPSHELAARNFEAALREGKVGKAMGYSLRDKRLKITKEMTPAQIEKAASAYRRKFIAHNAHTVATSSTLQTLKKGQALAWQDAISRGIVDTFRLEKTWIQVQRGDRRRESHIPLHGETVPFDSTYSNGDFIPGESDPWNCACLSRIRERRAA